MLTIAIIFTLLVALWGHHSAIAAARRQRGSNPHAASGGDHTRSIPSRGE